MKKSLKKLAALLLSATLLTGMFAGCGEKQNTDITPTPTTKTEQPAEPTKAPETEPTATPEPTLIVLPPLCRIACTFFLYRP